MSSYPNVERGILVFSIWGVFGVLGLGFLLEGFTRSAYFIALLGIGLIVVGFVAHIIVNAVFDQGFTNGETALGIGTLGVLALVFVLAWAEGGMPEENFYAGLTFFGVIVSGFIAYLVTRYGLRGAFSRFHVKTLSVAESER
jgi:hypothetical protein